MGSKNSKNKKGSKVSVDIRTGAAQPTVPDMSKYARAYSNKSKINYAELKLMRSSKASEPDEGETEAQQSARKKEKQSAKSQKKNEESPKVKDKKKAKSEKAKKVKETNKIKKDTKKLKTSKKQEESSVLPAEERYSNALGKEDHYSSAVEKYYLKYPDKKRPKKPSSSRRSTDIPSKKRRSYTGNIPPQTKRSMAEIAVKNKGSTSVKKYARAVGKAKARGVVSTKVANRTFYRPPKKSSGARNVLLITLLFLFLASVGVTVFFNVRAINVTGENPYGDARIKKVCSIRKGSNILFLSTDEMERKVEKELPYISECSVERRLPSSVVINVRKADVLGVIQGNAGQWLVLSSEGKILETVTNIPDAADSDNSGTISYTPEYNSLGEFAESRKIAELSGIDVKDCVKDGFITNEKQLTRIRNFSVIKNAFEKIKMKLTSITYSERGYEAEYDGRIVILFGDEIDKKTVSHHLDEVHALIFDKGYIAENDMGEIRFSKARVYFRQAYEVSEEQIERIHEQRRLTNREQLIEMAGIFMTVGDDWNHDKLLTE